MKLYAVFHVNSMLSIALLNRTVYGLLNVWLPQFLVLDSEKACNVSNYICLYTLYGDFVQTDAQYVLCVFSQFQRLPLQGRLTEVQLEKVMSIKKSHRSTFQLEQFIPFRLNVVSGMISALIEEQCLKPVNITLSEWRILTTLGAEGPSPQSRFVKRSPMDKITVTRTVKSLNEAGLVESTASAKDRRSRLLSLTDKGAILFKDITQHALKLENKVFVEAGIADRKAFIEQLNQLELATREIKRKANS